MNPSIALLKGHCSIRNFTDRYPQQHDSDTLTADDRTTNHEYPNRDSNLKNETWTQQMADLMGRVFRLHVKAFFGEEGLFP